MIVDTNVHLGRYPFRHSPFSSTRAIAERLAARGVTSAWAGSCEALFDRDIAGVNERLVRECREARQGLFVPFGSVNPLLPDWKDDLRRCREEHGMPGIRLYPTYHGYAPAAPEFAELLALAAEHRLAVQIVVQMEDTRTQHPVFQAPALDLAALAEAVAKLPPLRMQILNCAGRESDEVLLALARGRGVVFDFAMVEGLGGVARFAARVGNEHVAFGSHFPLFYVESAVLKLREADFAEADAEAIRAGNARRLIEG